MKRDPVSPFVLTRAATDHLWDTLGVSGSVICAVHCLVTPLLLAGLPVLAPQRLHDPAVEACLLASCAVFGLLSLPRSYRREHRRVCPLALFTAGIALFVWGHWGAPERFAHAITSLGAVAVAASHWANARLCLRCRSCAHLAPVVVATRP
jgi:hypothetical protein